MEALLVVVGVQSAGGSCEVLQAAGGRLPRSGAGDLHDLDTPGVLHSVVPGDGELVALVPGLQDHVVPGVGPADHGRVGSLALRREPGLDTAPAAPGVPVPRVGRGGGGQHELVEIESAMRYLDLGDLHHRPELADVRGGLADGEGAGGGGGGGTGEVGVVLGDPLPALGHEGAADPEATGTGAAGSSAQAPTLGGCVADSVAADGGVTTLIRELDYFEHAEELLLSGYLTGGSV